MVEQPRLDLVGEGDSVLGAEHIGGVIVLCARGHVVHRRKMEEMLDLALQFGAVIRVHTEERAWPDHRPPGCSVWPRLHPRRRGSLSTFFLLSARIRK